MCIVEISLQLYVVLNPKIPVIVDVFDIRNGTDYVCEIDTLSVNGLYSNNILNSDDCAFNSDIRLVTL